MDSSDTPSLYSRSAFSPQSSHFCSPSISSSLPVMSTINDLAVSMLDMDDDPRSSSIYDSVHDHDTSEDDYDENGVEDDQSVPRMSYLGPKMRYHSRAPWEMEDTPQEAEEDNAGVENQTSFSSSTTRVKAGITRHFGFGGSKSSGAGRSSEESNGSQKAPKMSFDSTSSHVSYSRDAHSNTPVHALSSTSQTPSKHGGSQRHLYPLVRSRPHSPFHSLSPQISPTSPRSPTPHFSEVTSSGIDSGNDSPTRSCSSFELDSKPSFNYQSEEHHPYANPDLVVSSSSLEEAITYTAHIPYKLSLSRSDISTIGSDSIISHTVNTYPCPSMALDPTPQSPSVASFRGQGKEISSPLSVRGSSWRGVDHSTGAESSSLPQPQLTNLPGWTERSTSPGFNLISLEEARAQRSRSITLHHPSTSNASAGSSGASNVFPFPENSGNGSGSSVASMTARARARSISAGTRAKQALNNIVSTTAPKSERRDSEPSVSTLNSSANGANSSSGPSGGKTLKNKRSGFLRLFNGGRDERSPPPPVPSLSEGFAAFNAQQASLQRPSVSSKINSHRIPVPQISPSLLDSSNGPSDDYLSVKSAIIATGSKRTPPPLSLHTSTHKAHLPGHLHPQSINDLAKSAPAHITEFPTLKLRPVSSMFSTQFGEHILSSPPSPETPSSAISPLTPGLYNRPDNFGSVTSENSSLSTGDADDHSVVIRKLQDQLSKSKLAHQQQIWELEGQVRDLKMELEDARSNGMKERDQLYCEHCGRGSRDVGISPSVVHRPRARTGTGQSRFGSAV
ncbi:hypothetical protein Moror_892 [Moniliophthora roreri MCA 2997]|uniref:Uncharacterized protein n=1 Tax=Moniliophthora roreri (strain MCA 2997) TaxID=1381753 RepID=V2Z1V9_MONRO|nr:hypothetical protein Moror_892 [Moniliophthora roreri MCA 2997]